MKKIGTQPTSTRPAQQKAQPAETAKKTENGKATTNDTAKKAESGSSVETSKEGREVKESRDARETGKNESTHRGEDKSELSKEAQEGEKLSDEDKSEIAELLKKLSENLEEGSKEPDKRIEDKGGSCCGRPKQPDKIIEGKTDWNQLLSADIFAVRAHQLSGGGGVQSAQGQPAGKTGVPGVQGAQSGGQNPARTAANTQGAGQTKPAQGATFIPGAPGANQAAPGTGESQTSGQGQPQDPLAKLSADYNRAKSSGAQLDERIEKECKQLLGIPDDKAQGQAIPGAHEAFAA